jgi:hypothetical protein
VADPVADIGAREWTDPAAMPHSSAAGGPANLQRERNNFVGRELPEIRRLLAIIRTVTLTTPGGDREKHSWRTTPRTNWAAASLRGLRAAEGPECCQGGSVKPS